MVLKLRSPFKLEADSTEASSSKNSSAVVGLRILTQISQGKSNVVVKSALKTTLPNSRKHHHHHRQSGRGSPPDQPCFLKSCHLCNKNLSLDKEVYMYRGDQGFCSIECRNRQIVLDEMRELELSTKHMVASYRHCSSSGRRETRVILEDLRRRNKSSPHDQNKNHWAIVS